ncbi:Abnormal spindle-like microcephaly-associated protein-like [Hondaea fermentalgiana]|uniref:Abnormal spindle-like microcephaly-associated protein-like n=1 Tax=Hondaea fermentalgiana TaxID=2315210 RepID=A0A2R5GT63_9STRA|nr:Abnormal spindle-like microcephaly-associated protein-like [Hondaea fermentalgiana]|eukprot:GBG33775.1 Abnormal spindle-like microcephaly-associated protein-like [Hondaea fermentalgiana]
MDLYVVERQLREAERELAQEVRAGEVAPGSPFAALRCERLYRTVGALRKKRADLVRSARSFEPHAVPRRRGGDSSSYRDRRDEALFRDWDRDTDRDPAKENVRAPLPPLPSSRFRAHAEKWLQAGDEENEDVWEWNGRALRVVKNVVYSDSDLLESLLAKARALEDKLTALEAKGSSNAAVSPNAQTWSEETKATVAAGSDLGDERTRAREAAREQLRKRATMLRQEHEQNSAIIVQSTFRGFLGRRKMREARTAYNARIREAGAQRIQAQFRGHLARTQVRQRKAAMQRDLEAASATVIQSTFRGARARRAYRDARTPEERRLAAAAMIQAWWRGCLGRREALSRRQRYLVELEEVAAIMLQSAWRSFQARCERDRLQAERTKAMQEAAAIMLQSAWRGYQARQRVERIRREREDVEDELKSMDYADNVRKSLFAKLFLNSEQRAAVAIQACARGFLERKRLRARRTRLAQRDREDAEIDRMIQQERQRRQGLDVPTPGQPTPKTVFEDTLNLPVQWSDGHREVTPVHILVRERTNPYQLRIEAEERTSQTRFYRMIDTAVLEELLLPVFSDVENKVVPRNLGQGGALGIEADAKPLANWILHGEPPRRKDLLAWILHRMWLDQSRLDGSLELCLGSFAGTDTLDKTMTSAIPPSSPPASRGTQHKAQQPIHIDTKPTREAFKVKYRNGSP